MQPDVSANTPTSTRSNGPLLLTTTIVVLVALMGVGIGLIVHGQQHVVAAATPTPVTATAILTQLQGANMQDATFTLNNLQTETLGTNVSVSLATTGKGTLTHSPQRLHILLDQTGSSALQITSNEVIVDGGVLYIHLTPAQRGKSKKTWLKLDSSLYGSSFSIIESLYIGVNTMDVTNYAQLTTVQLKGQEVLDGQKTWHLQGQIPNSDPSGSIGGISSSLTQTEDIWVRQDTHLPIQIILHQVQTVSLPATGTTGATSIGSTNDLTYTFTAWNTGVTITLPPASQVTDTIPLPTLPTPTPTPKP